MWYHFQEKGWSKGYMVQRTVYAPSKETSIKIKKEIDAPITPEDVVMKDVLTPNSSIFFGGLYHED